MVYRIIVDGIKKYAEAPIKEYSPEADNKARESIIRYYLDEKGAQNVYFDTSAEEVRALHEIADIFFEKVAGLKDALMSLPRDRKWDTREMEVIIPRLMEIYIAGMKLPSIEYTEDADYDREKYYFENILTDAGFEEKYDFYWEVFDPYCESDLYKDSQDPDGGLCKGWLRDDLSDTLCDLARGVDAYEAGLYCEAIFEWRWGLLNHYGNHITSALRAMCRIWEKETEHSDDDDYWAPDFDYREEYGKNGGRL